MAYEIVRIAHSTDFCKSSVIDTAERPRTEGINPNGLQTSRMRAITSETFKTKRQRNLPDRIRAVDAAAYRRRIEAETPTQSQAHRETYAEAHHLVRNRQRIRDEAIHFIEAQVETHNCGPMNIICQFRKSKYFAAERPSDGKFTSCCRKGKIKS
ncbi:hypothetical protein AVEN_38674-1 [Araneus ventricosus]|uniref:Uncharacterized protein n=1 Tax=Araneus ventricosus TaxID=182803 RepID=A0A4Y2LVV4_ARAVE|nr:hypothetical protein AVEN_38674-1 [Araneus ventricosus]